MAAGRGGGGTPFPQTLRHDRGLARARRALSRSAAPAAACLLLLLTACESPPPPASPPSAAAPQASATTRARQAIDRKDWAAAAPLLREAIAADPQNVSLHYDLAVSATYLNARDEAAREFRWVVANAAPDSQEAKAARSWLAEAGAPTAPASAPAPVTPAAPDKPAIPHVERTGDAGLYGRVTWSSEPGGPHSTRRMQVHLYGLPNTPSKDQRYTVRTDDEGRYEFKRIVGGPYKLTNKVAGSPEWRLRVQIEPGRETAFDLHPGNSIAVRDDFPEDGK